MDFKTNETPRNHTNGSATHADTQPKHGIRVVNEYSKRSIQRLSNKILASYLDITQETLSRLKSK